MLFALIKQYRNIFNIAPNNEYLVTSSGGVSKSMLKKSRLDFGWCIKKYAKKKQVEF